MRITKLLTIVFIITLIFSCKKKVEETDNLFKFKDYISYTTSGRISVASAIEINLANDVKAWEINQEITDDIVTIKPHVSGKLLVNNKHSLRFVPDEALDKDTEYTVDVKLGKIYNNIPADFKTYTFQFKTITPNFNIVTIIYNLTVKNGNI